jgi:PAS domain S-box-containing protein
MMTRPRSAFPPGARRHRLHPSSVLISLAVATLLVATFLPRLYNRPFSTVLLTLVLIALAAAIALHVRFLVLAQREQRETADALSITEHEFQAIFDSALDALLILDERGICIEANPAALAVLGARRDQLVGQPIRHFELTPLELQTMKDDLLGEKEGRGEMQVLREDGGPILVEYSVKANYLPRRHLVALRDITARRSAEEQMARNLRLAESARAEADALRKSTLALTQNLSMDYVLDTLLASLLDLIPCESAQVLLAETADRLFLARELHSPGAHPLAHKSPVTWNVPDHRPLMHVLLTQKSLLVPNTAEEEGWNQFIGHRHFRSWLCVPLVASQSILGLLSLGDSETDAFTPEHLRLAQSLALPAAVAIQNARLYERAEIYGAELERRLADLERAQRALEKAEEHRALSEDKFTKVFRSSPIAFSITTLEEGRILDVNEAFERRYGYSRDDLIGHTVLEIGIWEHPEERLRMVEEIRAHGSIRNHATRLRKLSGEVVDTIYSAQTVQLDDQPCILAVTEDLPDRAQLQASLARASTLAR